MRLVVMLVKQYEIGTIFNALLPTKTYRFPNPSQNLSVQHDNIWKQFFQSRLNNT